MDSVQTAPQLETRSFVTVADAAELVASPELLAAYAGAFGPGDDATLVICAPETEDGLVAELSERIAGASLDGEDGPDMLLVCEPHPAAFELSVDAKLTASPRAYEQPPEFGVPQIAPLARLYERTKSRAAATAGPHDSQLLELLADPHRHQQLRIARFEALSTCPNVRGVPVRNQPVLFVGDGTVDLGEEVQFGWPESPCFHSTYAYVQVSRPDAAIRLGDRCLFNNGVTLRSEGPGIEIGAEALFGTEVQVFDSDFHDMHPARRRGGQPKMAQVRIGRNVWLGSNVIVLRGVTIGDDTIVGAGSVVSRSLPAGVIAAGNPARVVRALED
jgi:acetyltransferase-like isoleucine patch superfamily enzyme